MTFGYTPEWLETQTGGREWAERCFLAALALYGYPQSTGDFGWHYGFPESLLDVGCGSGWIPRLAAQLGIESVGVDIALASYSEAWPNCVLLKKDLTKPLDFGRRFDLVVSWEVGEHLPVECADTFVDTLATHTGKFLLFTAAVPGQGGDGHINCQEREWWRERLESRGLRYLPEATEFMKGVWRWAAGNCSWYPQNIQIFQKTEA